MHAHIKRWAIDLKMPVNFTKPEFKAKLTDVVVVCNPASYPGLPVVNMHDEKTKVQS